MILQGLPVPYC